MLRTRFCCVSETCGCIAVVRRNILHNARKDSTSALSHLIEGLDVTTTYRSADGRRATLSDLIAQLQYVARDIEAAAAAGMLPDPLAAQGLARVLEHHCRRFEAELSAEPGRRTHQS